MSLLVWLPMIKDLTQQGISDITVSNVGATLNTNGKLGKCYYFDGNANYLEFSKTVGDLYSGDFSYAVWLKPTDDTRSIICSEYASSGSSNIAFELSAARGIRLYWNGAPDIYPTNCTLPKNEWSHVVITRSGNEAKFYINGEIRYTYNGTLIDRTSTSKIRLGDDYRGGTSVSYMGYMNDFRLYNHCLSAKEIKELSKGLVCHYPLNGNGRSVSNLIHHTNIDKYGLGYMTTYSSGSITVDTDEIFHGQPTIRIQPSTSTTSSGATNRYNNTVNLTANVKYCYSCWIKSTVADTFTTSSLGHFQTYTSSAAHNRTINHEGDSIPANIWTKVHIVFTPTVDCLFFSYFIYFANTSQKIWIADVKLEEADHSTSWMPSSTDDEYNTLGYNDNTEYDTSGYQNNMTKTGTITYTSDSARYSVSSHFINGSYLMANQNSPEYLPKDAITVNLWVKPTTWANPISCTESGGWNFEGSPVQFPCFISGVGYKVAVSNVTGASLQDGKWHMLTASYNSISQEVKIYIDGVLKGTTATGSSNGIGYASNRLIISGEAGGGTSVASSSYVGEESDVRIYATALSDEDIKELYQTAATIDKNGTLLGYELVEV